MKTLAIYRESPQRWSLLVIEDCIVVTTEPRVKVAHRVAGPLSRRELDRVLQERIAVSPDEQKDRT